MDNKIFVMEPDKNYTVRILTDVPEWITRTHYIQPSSDLKVICPVCDSLNETCLTKEKENKMKRVVTFDILEMISAMIDDGIMFTMYDVTKSLRHAGFLANHSEVKMLLPQNDIDDILDIADYKRTFNRDLKAWIYHHEDDDPDQYDKDLIPSIGGKPVTLSTAPTTSQSSSIFNKQGRFCVPSDIVRQAGLESGDTVKFVVWVDRLVIEKDASDYDAKVDCYDNIRIPSRFFPFNNKTSLTKDDLSYQINGDSIIITVK